VLLFSLLRPRTVNDLVVGTLTRRHRNWRGRVSLGAHSNVPLLTTGGRTGTDGIALALAHELPSRYATLQPEIGRALFEHYQPYWQAFEAGKINGRIVQLTDAAEVWPHVTPVHVIVGPVSVFDRLSIEIGYSTQWDIEHTVGAIVADWHLVELNGSLRGVGRW
jgi:hypothetical protein